MTLSVADQAQTIAPPDLIPARMLNEFVYCPRLCFLEWVQQEWCENQWTLDGTFRHRRVDHPGGHLPDPDELKELDPTETLHARSLLLSGEEAGLIAKIDLIEAEADEVIPVEYKRGAVPNNEERSWEPERIQLAAQAIILRENGYTCHRGVLYYCQSKQRVEILIDNVLIHRTLHYVHTLKETVRKSELPAPLVDSPKCPGCSLVGICLPDETHYAADHENETAKEDSIRRLYPARDDAIPFYVQEQGAYIGKSGEEVNVTKQKKTIQKIRLMELSQICVFGSVQVTTQLVQELIRRSIPILYFSYGGWFHGLSTGMMHKNVELRRCQFTVSALPQSLDIARALVRNKIQNCRILLRRNSQDDVSQVIAELRQCEQQASEAQSMDTLLGYEGNAARIYFQHFSTMIKQRGDTKSALPGFEFHSRNRRPPRDPVNALLSLAYSLLTKELTITLLAIGFDPFLGFYHQPRYGRPALALDLMEPFRPLIADSVVLTAINNGVVQSDDFVYSGGAAALKPEARKRFILAYERRMDTLITHPVFNYRVSYRRVLEIQARLLGRYLYGEIKTPPEFITR